MKFPKLSQWKQLFKILRGAERKVFFVLISVALASFAYLAVSFYLNNTRVAPAFGGDFTEGIVGQPRYINPIYGETNDVDRALISLIYSGLMAYDKDGRIVNDLSDSYQISPDGKTYTFNLKNNLFWQDGMPLTADDVIYTIEVIQSSEYKSPLRANWLDVSAKKISDKSFSLVLRAPYNSFLENCTIKIIPQHIWKNVLPENFALSPYNLQPVGSGPYTLKKIEEENSGFIKSVSLQTNPKYYGKPPYITNLYVRFFTSEDQLIKSANARAIDGFSAFSPEDKESFKKFSAYSFSLPRYFAVFFNQDKEHILSDVNIAQALNYAVDKNQIAKDVSVVNSPILPSYFNFSESAIGYNFDPDSAKKLLDKSGFKENDSGTRSKPNTKKPAFQFKSYLKNGSSGSEVAELHGCLTRLDESFKNILADEKSGKYTKITENAVLEFQKKYLPNTPPTGETGPGTRQKLNEICFPQQQNTIPLKLTLTVIDQPKMIETANILVQYWKQVGADVSIKTASFLEIKKIIKDRDYDALLYGQALGALPDLYPFWHSTQIKDPGLNLSAFQNKNVDQLLKEAREASNEQEKNQKLQKLQDAILSSAPALFLYNPDYVYLVSKKIKGIDTTKIVDPAKRFANISNWYINTKRVLK